MSNLRKGGLETMHRDDLLSSEDLDILVLNDINNHGTTSGQTYLMGYIKSLG